MFQSMQMLPPDPILGLMVEFNNDSNPNKIDLGVGVYKDEDGETVVLGAVKKAEVIRTETETTKVYIGPPGSPGFNESMLELLFGASHSALLANRLRSIQTPGGCGGLRVAAELIKRAKSDATVWVSAPTWANHIPLMSEAGLQIKEYPYYDQATNSLQFDDMMATLEGVKAGDLVLLHGCCHNPCGADLSQAQWQAVADLAVKNGFTPFIDTAYQGFADGLEEDAYGVRLMAEKVPELIVVASCSKNFGLYRERTGALMFLGQQPAHADAVATQVFNITRGMYSMPPAHGGILVDVILHDNALRQEWVDELTTMRNRINTLRARFADTMAAKGAAKDFSFIKDQRGMFSFLGITPEQVQRLKTEYSIYVVGSSRVNIAGISERNLDYLTDAVAAVL
jgi:aspartate aminotransferase